jgi:hypothetical protein
LGLGQFKVVGDVITKMKGYVCVINQYYSVKSF